MMTIFLSSCHLIFTFMALNRIIIVLIVSFLTGVIYFFYSDKYEMMHSLELTQNPHPQVGKILSTTPQFSSREEQEYRPTKEEKNKDTIKLITINGIEVPPEPDQNLNNSTIEGIDLNKNSIRDDVEIKIAKDFGSDPSKYKQAKDIALAEQLLITNPTDEIKRNYARIVTCDSLTSSESDSITFTSFNTSDRGDIYANVLTGISGEVGNDVCE